MATTTRQLTCVARLFAVLLLLALPASAAYARTYSNQSMGGVGTGTGDSGNSLGVRAVAIAKHYLGVKYKWGGANPKTGFDCSGLTMYVYAKLGVKLLHYTGDQWREGYRIGRSQLHRGDLVFFDMSKGGDPQHVGMYVGNNKFIQAPHTGDVVKISTLTGNYAKNYVGAVRPYGYGPPFIFPVVGPSRYTNDFGQSGNQGIDISAPRHSLVVAPEAGRIQLWHNKAAGCAMTLFGNSLVTYVFTHLNNDTTAHNDNLGKCVGGTAYAPNLRTGSIVKGAQVIGFVGDSGSADGTAPHLNIEVHPKRGDAANPYPYLNRAKRLVFASLPGKFSLRLMGTLGTIDPSDPSNIMVKVRVDKLRAYPGDFLITKVSRTLSVDVTDTTIIKKQHTGPPTIGTEADLLSAPANSAITVWTVPQKRTLDAQLGYLPLSAAVVVIQIA